MARYSSFLGRMVEVQYRASDTLLPASGIFVADSGRSIFLEQIFEQRGQHRVFRWEIPYQFLIKIALCKEDEPAPMEAAELNAPPANKSSFAESKSEPAVENRLASSAAAGLGLVSSVLPTGRRPKTV
jgi:hypothetical protein